LSTELFQYPPRIDITPLLIKNLFLEYERSDFIMKKFFPASIQNILLLFYIFFLLISCGYQDKWQTTTLLYFDTLCEIKLQCPDKIFSSTLEEINTLFTRIEELFSPDSSHKDSGDVFKLFNIAKKIYSDSHGDFDITIAPLSHLWGFHNPPNRIPGQKEIIAALTSVGLDKINIHDETLSIPEGMNFDWGGIAKGFGVDRAVEICRKKGIPHGFINAGGDLFCWGNNPQGQLWKIGIKHPREEGFLGVLSITESGAATTGDYQRYFIKEGIRYHHVLDPKTGYPAEGKQSVTVIGPETVFCDALSTALFVSEIPEKIIQKYREYSAVIVDSDGKLSFLGKKINFSAGPK